MCLISFNTIVGGILSTKSTNVLTLQIIQKILLTIQIHSSDCGIHNNMSLKNMKTSNDNDQ